VKILVAADMEGITGVVEWEHVDSKHGEYGRFRKLMTGDVNAAIRGAFSAGASEVIVADGHGNGRNLLIEELDARARLNCGSPSPLAMVQGLEAGIKAAMFVGYHARAGAGQAILCHTWSSRVANLWLNGTLVGEIGLNAAMCGHFGLPVILVTGDQTACTEARNLLGPVETAVVKQASSRKSAECLPPEVAQKRICEAAGRAVGRLRAGDGPEPLRLESPIEVVIELVDVETADRAGFLPGASRGEGNRVEIQAEDMPAAYRAFRAALALTYA